VGLGNRRVFCNPLCRQRHYNRKAQRRTDAKRAVAEAKRAVAESHAESHAEDRARRPLDTSAILARLRAAGALRNDPSATWIRDVYGVCGKQLKKTDHYGIQ
jgi:hypothetical protein